MVVAVVAWCGVLWSILGADAGTIAKVIKSVSNNDRMADMISAAIDRIIHFQFVGDAALNNIVLVPIALIIVLAFAVYMAGRGNR
jgi:hypothetical protein